MRGAALLTLTLVAALLSLAYPATASADDGFAFTCADHLLTLATRERALAGLDTTAGATPPQEEADELAAADDLYHPGSGKDEVVAMVYGMSYPCDAMFDAWMESAPHRAIILDEMSCTQRYAVATAASGALYGVGDMEFAAAACPFEGSVPPDPGLLAETWDGTFADDDGTVFENDIEALAASGTTSGCNVYGTLFCPDDSVTRGQMAAFLVRALDLTAGGPGFVDTVGHVFAGDAAILAASGITAGCNTAGTHFCPDAPVTRGQMAAFLVRALGLTGDGPSFADTAATIFAADIAALAGAEITLGCNPPANTRFCPDAPVTRGQMAAFLVRAGLAG